MVSLIIAIVMAIVGYVLLAYTAYHHGYTNGISEGYDMVQQCIEKGYVIEHRTRSEKA